MGECGAALINDGDNILTHCNTGERAAAGKRSRRLTYRSPHYCLRTPCLVCLGACVLAVLEQVPSQRRA